MATSLSPDLTSSQVRGLLDELEWSERLPVALFNEQGDLVYQSTRFRELLETPEGPCSARDVEKRFAFKTEFDAGPKLWNRVIGDPIEKDPLSWVCDLGLKHYQLVVKKWSLGRKQKGRALLAKVLRSGDLLSDSASRQALFHTLSHEIRTSLLAMKGHLQMAQQGDVTVQKASLERMEQILKRLDRVVLRMSDLREELKP